MANGPSVDELADRLIEKRERLHYFIVTASAAFIAFSLGLLEPLEGIRAVTRWGVGVGGVSLLVAAGIALAGLAYRHWVYARYLDAVSGVRPHPTREEQQAIRTRFFMLEMSMIAFFFG